MVKARTEQEAGEDTCLPLSLVVCKEEAGEHPSFSTAEALDSPNACSYGQQARLSLGTSAEDQLFWA